MRLQRNEKFFRPVQWSASTEKLLCEYEKLVDDNSEHVHPPARSLR